MKENLFRSDLEKTQHLDAIARLSQEFPGQEPFVDKCYWEFLAPLITEASIRTYLAILVSRKVRRTLLERQRMQ